MNKYRIVALKDDNNMYYYQIQKKCLWWWKTLSDPYKTLITPWRIFTEPWEALSLKNAISKLHEIEEDERSKTRKYVYHCDWRNLNE